MIKITVLSFLLCSPFILGQKNNYPKTDDFIRSVIIDTTVCISGIKWIEKDKDKAIRNIYVNSLKNGNVSV